MSEPTEDPDSDVERVAPGADLDSDLDPGDHLLGLSPRTLLETRALRGVAMIAVSLVIVLWPDRTDRVLAVLAGLGLGIYSVFTAWELLRSKVRAEFVRIISVGLAFGAAVALVTSPTDSLRSSTQLAGLLLLAAALREPLLMVLAREFSSWSAAKAVTLGLGGALLLAFPETLLAAATSIAAGLLAAGGLVSVFTEPEAGPPREQGDDAMSGARRVRDAVLDWIADRPEAAEDRQTLQEKLYFEGPEARVRFARFVTLMTFAAIIASVGVMVESTAVVIGAMLIAPLMVPLMGVALALPMGWPRRLRRGVVVGLTGVAIAIATGAVVGSVAPRTIDVSTNAEVLARITPTSVDLAIAVAAGAAGAYALGRRDVSDSLPGVAVAIALVPPLAVVGLCWEQGAWQEGNGALLLFLTNAVAILLAGGVTFVLLGTAPIEAVSRGQERISTAIAGVVALAAVVVLLLLLNGTSLAEAELARADLDNVLVDWTDRHEDWRVIDRRVLDASTFVFDLAGPGRPPELRDLLTDLERAAGDDTTVRVTWIEQQQVQRGGD
jgi:uncharacterized hydrophobic protein (TIGR00271 family)